jgi:hypothetical protein
VSAYLLCLAVLALWALGFATLRPDRVFASAGPAWPTELVAGATALLCLAALLAG